MRTMEASPAPVKSNRNKMRILGMLTASNALVVSCGIGYAYNDYIDDTSECTVYDDNVKIDGGLFIDEESAEAINASTDILPDVHQSPNQYLDEVIGSLSGDDSPQIPINVDPSAGPKKWGSSMENDQRSTINFVTNLVSMVNTFNPDVVEALGVSEVRLQDLSEDYAGFVDGSSIKLEYDGDQRPAGSYAGVIVHEFGHALQNKLCGGEFKDDINLSSHNSIEYTGYLPDRASDNERELHSKKVPKNLTAYGKQREFFTNYAASSAKEDFANVFESTLMSRGLIQYGDADYGSPLYYKQKAVVSALDRAMPGFKTEVETRTSYLRLDPENEVNWLAPKISIDQDSLRRSLDRSPNGAIALKGFFTYPEAQLHTPASDLYCGPEIVWSDTWPNLEITTSKVYSEYGETGRNYSPVSTESQPTVSLAVPKDKVDFYAEHPNEVINTMPDTSSGSSRVEQCGDTTVQSTDISSEGLDLNGYSLMFVTLGEPALLNSD